jgi:hypothetical protein
MRPGEGVAQRGAVLRLRSDHRLAVTPDVERREPALSQRAGLREAPRCGIGEEIHAETQPIRHPKGRGTATKRLRHRPLPAKQAPVELRSRAIRAAQQLRLDRAAVVERDRHRSHGAIR